MKSLSATQNELRCVLSEADAITKRNSIDKPTEARLNFLLAKIKTLSAGAALPASAAEVRNAFFHKLIETRATMQEGTQTIAYAQGPDGGYLVPNEFHNEVVQGMAQYDPLLDENVVTLIQSEDFSLRPYTIPGIDLSTFAAVKVAEGVQQTGQVPPVVSGVMQNAYKYKASIPATIELEQDSFVPLMKTMSSAFSVGLARGIGIDLVNGNGSTAPAGVVTGAGASVYTTASVGKLSLTDFASVYFSVDRYHRANPKAAWCMSDAVYQLARRATDSVGNPLIKICHDEETIMGKRVYVCPSLPLYNPSLGTQAAGSFVVFGNLSQYFVRVSQMVVKRMWELPGYVENGKVLYCGYMRADAKIVDPSNGFAPPIVQAILAS